MIEKKTVCVDFDGVLNNYKGYAGEAELYEPMIGAREFLLKLSKEYKVVIFSTRASSQKIWEWLREYNLRQYCSDVTNIKPVAVAYIDDRAIRFEGNYSKVLDELKDFKTHWE